MAMTVSGNRTNILLTSAWGPSVNNDSVSLVLSRLRQANRKIWTFISDEGAALLSMIHVFSPGSYHKFCAYS